MIALCRAKCWIIQLRDDDCDSKIPTTQRGVKGHIIIYPQRPSAIATTLPPSIDDVITPICVIFVGSSPPTQEWLQKKASPLIVRKEKVMTALAWLKIHNHLYCDVAIDHTVLAGQPDETLLPFHVQHIVPNAGIDSTTSTYVPGSAAPPPADESPSIPNLAEILNPNLTAAQFQSVVVADVDGNAPSNELRSAALKHMQKAGSNYIELPHDRKPANEFKNPTLFPMMYPTLFPYGLGGLEDEARKTRLGVEPSCFTQV
ncbi:hypothetical protein DFH09DRAFT_1249413 [Mycena vulgaris]|nr:hypothetical protein DFH09DRAFT_1249413 [Mycena vulgaris]